MCTNTRLLIGLVLPPPAHGAHASINHQPSGRGARDPTLCGDALDGLALLGLQLVGDRLCAAGIGQPRASGSGACATSRRHLIRIH